MEQSYPITQWILYFFIYSFLGWIWESCYVSVSEHHLTNRGFIRGPFLPIYGASALIMLIVSAPFLSHPLLVFLFGMLGASCLEYLTGFLMNLLFQVRYWDYSEKKFNLNGYICLSSALLWGFFTLLLNRFFQVYVSRFVMLFSLPLQNSASLILSVLFCIDFAVSFHQAFRFGQLLIRVHAIRIELIDLSSKAEQELRNTLSSTASAGQGILSNAASAVSPSALLKKLSKARNRLSCLLSQNSLMEKSSLRLRAMQTTRLLRGISGIMDELLLLTRSAGKNTSEKLSSALETFLQWKEKLSAITSAFTLHQRQVLKNNTHLISEKYQAELEFFREYLKKHSDS